MYERYYIGALHVFFINAISKMCPVAKKRMSNAIFERAFLTALRKCKFITVNFNISHFALKMYAHRKLVNMKKVSGRWKTYVIVCPGMCHLNTQLVVIIFVTSMETIASMKK